MGEASNGPWYYIENGQQAGPLGEAEIPALISSGRLTRDTLVWNSGQSDWQAAGKTSLGPLFGQAPPPLFPGAVAAPVVEEPGKVQIFACIKEAFGLMTKNLVPLWLGNIIVMIMAGFSLGLVDGNWRASILLMVHKARKGEPVVFGDIFLGFNRLGTLLGAGLIYSLAVLSGLYFLIIPGLLAAAYLIYTVPLVAIKGMSLGDAMKASGEMVKGHLWRHVLFLIVLSLIGIGVALVLALLLSLLHLPVFIALVPLLFLVPLYPIAIAVAFEENLRLREKDQAGRNSSQPGAGGQDVEGVGQGVKHQP